MLLFPAGLLSYRISTLLWASPTLSSLGSCPEKGVSISSLLLLSSPRLNVTTGHLTFSATKLPGWNAGIKEKLGDSRVIVLDKVQLVIDSTVSTVETVGKDVLDAGVKECAG